ncbi:MAG: hypothetical protein KatS3mg010_0417 [Acidimicrobiia bacterium]|nr:MAG: hypothetical protein KatS3mg010_0417 [Acidimicrobiia bacterium]
MLLEGKVAIVSGVGPGLGQANARALAREGATVVLAARNAEYLEQVRAEIERSGGSAEAVPTNVVEREQVSALVERTADRYGRLDVLVNNAFRMDRGQPFAEADLDLWRKVFEVNFWGALTLTQAALPHLAATAAEHGDASVVFVLSMSMRKIRPNEGGYATSKGALHTAVQSLALELGPRKVRVNGVAPGWIAGAERRDVHRVGVAVARRRAGGRPARDRGPHPARRDPPAGRHRELRGVLRLALVPRRHRADARRQRR